MNSGQKGILRDQIRVMIKSNDKSNDFLGCNFLCVCKLLKYKVIKMVLHFGPLLSLDFEDCFLKATFLHLGK